MVTWSILKIEASLQILPPNILWRMFVLRYERSLLNMVVVYYIYIFQYVAELSLLELEMAIMFPPSVVAASAYCLANYTLSRDLWVRFTNLMWTRAF